jgi:hypothetical protein
MPVAPPFATDASRVAGLAADSAEQEDCSRRILGQMTNGEEFALN